MSVIDSWKLSVFGEIIIIVTNGNLAMYNTITHYNHLMYL